LATSEFRNELKDDYLKQQQRIKERVDQISCLMSVLKEDPYIKKAIEQNGYDVDIPGIPDF
uniref:Enkurin domain-containing protein n=1 Tax=Anisakis simplex TaxID=6269 RepID=A0A0M3J1J4_ANISI